jgi:hypothetical protein
MLADAEALAVADAAAGLLPAAPLARAPRHWHWLWPQALRPAPPAALSACLPAQSVCYSIAGYERRMPRTPWPLLPALAQPHRRPVAERA